MIDTLVDLAERFDRHLSNLIPFTYNKDILLLYKQANLTCYTKEELNKYNQIINELTVTCNTKSNIVKVDTTKEKDWIVKNSKCVTKELYEFYSEDICIYRGLILNVKEIPSVCKDFKVTVTKKDISCNLAIDIVEKDLDCKVRTSVYLYKKLCDLKVKIVNDESKNCKINYNILQSNTTTNLSYTDYKNLIDQNLSYDVIHTLCKNKIEPVIKNGTIYLKFNNNIYNINELDIDMSKFTKEDYKQLISFLTSYNLTELQKQQIINGK